MRVPGGFDSPVPRPSPLLAPSPPITTAAAPQELNCTEPSIVFTKTPANFTSKYHSAPVFTSKECKVKKTFGDAVQKVLFVFDGQQAPDITALTAQASKGAAACCGAAGCRALQQQPPSCPAPREPLAPSHPLQPPTTVPIACPLARLQITQEVKNVLGTVSSDTQSIINAKMQLLTGLSAHGTGGAASGPAPAFAYN